MQSYSLAQLLSAAVSPMLVISAAGLVLLSMTNRYARVIDRSRAYLNEVRTLEPQTPEAEIARYELGLVWRRARLLRLAITLATVSVLFVVVTVLGLFTDLLTDRELSSLVLGCFAATLLTLGGSLVVFVWDMSLSLRALEFEIQRAGIDPGKASTL